ncbi:MAG: hypothetical protein IPM82_21720 [Saprospiraceae bacterium]|nr:hypothetical protein [Saprospiraceae bacterium]
MTKAQSGTITPNESQKYEESLGKKQQAIANQEEKASQELKEQTNNFDEKFVGDIKHFADSLQQANGYDYVLIHGGIVSPMLTANENTTSPKCWLTSSTQRNSAFDCLIAGIAGSVVQFPSTVITIASPKDKGHPSDLILGMKKALDSSGITPMIGEKNVKSISGKPTIGYRN